MLLVAAWAMRRGAAAPTGARVVLRLPLAPRHTIDVVELAGRHLVLGGSDGGLSVLTELDAQAAARLVPSPTELTSLLPSWKRA